MSSTDEAKYRSLKKVRTLGALGTTWWNNGSGIAENKVRGDHTQCCDTSETLSQTLESCYICSESHTSAHAVSCIALVLSSGVGTGSLESKPRAKEGTPSVTTRTVRPESSIPPK